MNNITYQEERNSSKLEKYEWLRIWFEDTEDTDAKRVLYIGDSISEGTYKYATNLTERKVIFNNLATSKAVDNPNYYSFISMFISENNKKDAIIINNGLHGWHLSEEEYREHYQKLIKKIKTDFPEVPLYILLTTATTEATKCRDRVPVRNAAAKQIAEDENLQVIDLYSVTNGHTEYYKPDGVHFVEKGYVALASEILKSLDM